MDRLKTSEIKEAKEVLLEAQKNKCPLCNINLLEEEPRNVCLDHSHITGQIREVLCRNCNAIEGRIWNFANRAKRGGTIIEWLEKMMNYIEHHENNPSGIYHPKYRTDEEKRISRNKKAKKRRQQKKKEKENG